jgi:hypothetical protein
MKLGDYIRSLSTVERDEYARRCGTTPGYLNIHILHSRKEPRRALREALARESDEKVSIAEVLEHFGMGTSSESSAA